jgi:hypothetical protein
MPNVVDIVDVNNSVHDDYTHVVTPMTTCYCNYSSHYPDTVVAASLSVVAVVMMVALVVVAVVMATTVAVNNNAD